MWGSLEGSGVWIDAVGVVWECCYVLPHSSIRVLTVVWGNGKCGDRWREAAYGLMQWAQYGNGVTFFFVIIFIFVGGSR